ncbi:uncharacterized protein LY89DRAFT_784240 [Mollisia scopiformis]|uniref:CYTH domain-containing protein n=1 Tax=Mollisia scopiformis TaxID=149040 RepID=A0A194X356_MOLSC|nr:uncharacterized protein LY89DRAFT_784240 [Mollisia scopiformis]KUJ14257.1 hypothetical protein LY89DRAFT_784240 [Mollisia scopiformis]
MRSYEIEQKFAFNLALLARFRTNRGSPPFRSLCHQQTERLQDEYFDSANQLSKNGVWIRKRNESWEAKHRQGGDYLRSSFYETDKVDEIKRLVAKYAPAEDSPRLEANFGLNSICRYLTTRETFVADHRFTIMLDSTDFGHSVGEVELQTRDPTAAHADIDKFMQKYAWFFVNKTPPKGKMTAYFELYGHPSKSDL